MKDELLDGGWIIVENGFVVGSEGDLEYLIKTIPWKQEAGRFGPVPRLNAWYADKGLPYSYSGIDHVGSGWQNDLVVLAGDLVNNYGKRMIVGFKPFNSCLLNYYRDGNDSIGGHTDCEPNLGENPLVASVSFGATRKFKIVHKTAKNGKFRVRKEYDLPNGSLVVMGGTMQHYWLHELPKQKEVKEPRVSLTFRRIISG